MWINVKIQLFYNNPSSPPLSDTYETSGVARNYLYEAMGQTRARDEPLKAPSRLESGEDGIYTFSVSMA